jgi:hypothetical protein
MKRPKALALYSWPQVTDLSPLRRYLIANSPKGHHWNPNSDIDDPYFFCGLSCFNMGYLVEAEASWDVPTCGPCKAWREKMYVAEPTVKDQTWEDKLAERKFTTKANQLARWFGGGTEVEDAG